MKKLIKYELKGCYKELLVLVSLQIIANTFIFIKADKLRLNTSIILWVVIYAISLITVFIFNIKIFVRDLYTNTSYLIFSIPKKSADILKSKIVMSLIQATLICLISYGFIYFIGMKVLNTRTIIHYTQIYSIVHDVPKVILVGGPFFILSYAKVIVIVYFSICLSKITKRKKKFGKLHSAIIFVIINVLIEQFNSVINSIFHESLNLNSVILRYVNNNMNFYLEKNINIGSQAFNLLVFILFLKLVGYMMDNVVEI